MKIKNISKNILVVASKGLQQDGELNNIDSNVTLYVNITNGRAVLARNEWNNKEKCIKAIKHKSSIKNINHSYVLGRGLKVKTARQAKILFLLLQEFSLNGTRVNKLYKLFLEREEYFFSLMERYYNIFN